MAGETSVLQPIMVKITLEALTDDALIAETRRVADAERRSTANLLELLNEIERRRLHLALGYASLFAYCTRALALSEQAAYSRITAAGAPGGSQCSSIGWRLAR